jgi:seryl-tRNA synthetase
VIDLRKLRENPDQFLARLNLRGDYSAPIGQILTLDQQQRQIEVERSQLQARSNEIGKLVGQKIKSVGKDDPEVQALRDEGNQIKAQLGELEPQEKAIKAELEALALTIPNLPDPATPVGKTEDDNVEIKRWGDVIQRAGIQKQ